MPCATLLALIEKYTFLIYGRFFKIKCVVYLNL